MIPMNEEKAMLSNLKITFFIDHKWLGCILTLKMQVHVWNNVQIYGSLQICDFVKEKANTCKSTR